MTNSIDKKFKDIEQLEIYQESRKLTLMIYQITNMNIFKKDYELKRQTRRASISIMSNIAEGFERGSDKDFRKFLFISRGSTGEVLAQITIAYDLHYIDETTYSGIKNKCKYINRMLTNFIKYLSKDI
jgi:four helix bundle protein